MNFAPCRVGDGGRTLHLAGGVDLPVPVPRVVECARHQGGTLTFAEVQHPAWGRSDDSA